VFTFRICQDLIVVNSEDEFDVLVEFKDSMNEVAVH
jgi:hypothetical protein